MPEETHATTAPAEPGGNPLLRLDPGLAIWTVITFAILMVVLKKLAWGPMLDTLAKREKAIAEALLQAEKARAAAASSIEEQQRLLADARREAQEFMARVRSDAERSRNDLIAKAREEADKLVVAGRQAIDQERRAAVQEIRKTAVDLALAASAKLMKSSIDETKGRELVKGYIRELEETGGSKPS